MKNIEKYMTADEAYRSFVEFCCKYKCRNCRFGNRVKPVGCALEWLYDEAEKGDEMSNKQETVADIVADIRAQNQGLPEDSYALSPLVCDLLSFADRIEAAAKREREAGSEAAQICGKIGELIGREAACKEVTDCNHLGNAAKMREALSRILGITDHLQTRFAIPKFASEEILELKQIAEAALSSTPRNCDVLSKDEVLKVLDDRSFSKEDTIEWLYEEAKGETK